MECNTSSPNLLCTATNPCHNPPPPPSTEGNRGCSWDQCTSHLSCVISPVFVVWHVAATPRLVVPPTDAFAPCVASLVVQQPLLPCVHAPRHVCFDDPSRPWWPLSLSDLATHHRRLCSSAVLVHLLATAHGASQCILSKFQLHFHFTRLQRFRPAGAAPCRPPLSTTSSRLALVARVQASAHITLHARGS